jgi:threonine/homoserine/homoserine lactone efflux protein
MYLSGLLGAGRQVLGREGTRRIGPEDLCALRLRDSAVTLKYAGVAYLLYMAWNTLRDRGALTVEETAPRSEAKVIGSGILINIFNPKLTIFFAFLPQFVRTNEPMAFLRMIELSAIFMLVTFVVFVAYGAFAAAVRTRVISRPRVMTWMRRVFAGSFAVLAGRLALTDR